VARYKPDHVITVTTTASRFVPMTGTRLADPAGDPTRLTLSGTGHTSGMVKPLEPLLAAAAMRAHRGAYTEDRDRRSDMPVLCPRRWVARKPARYCDTGPGQPPAGEARVLARGWAV